MNGKGKWGQNHVPRMKLPVPELPKPSQNQLPAKDISAKRPTQPLDTLPDNLPDVFEAKYSRRKKRARVEKSLNSTEQYGIQATNASEFSMQGKIYRQIYR